ncbi:MAG: glycosyltransferase family 2 protein [Spirochaetales bacterium]|nr:glycosyltransferase family 2 protein [Leptospiraceae bacterium]MCP5483606.1 glycosyltransferase family 2 protein [Spirochaetales bacterium]MCP5484528.1 glycosyltransferase family 2 protein [Spirochaetales bacterium]
MPGPETRARVRTDQTTDRPDGLSVCIITLNEQDRLPRCLDSVSFADELIVVDSGSKDETAAVARERGARVVKRAFEGFVIQKNFAISLARFEWVLVIDADEVVTPELARAIQEVTGRDDVQANGPVAYRVARMSYYLGRWIRHSGWYPDYNIRLFRRGFASFEGGTVHETVVPMGPVATLPGHLEHYSYGDISDHLARIDAYSTLLAQDKHRRGKRSSIPWAITKSCSKFFLTYVYRLGFLDGYAGLVIAVLGAYYNFLKYVKLWELNHGLRRFRPIVDPAKLARDAAEVEIRMLERS